VLQTGLFGGAVVVRADRWIDFIQSARNRRWRTMFTTSSGEYWPK
jgi:hypothetical protein